LLKNLQKQPLTELVLADIAPLRDAALVADRRVRSVNGDLAQQLTDGLLHGVDGVFHLAAAVSGECEADIDVGLRTNLDSTRVLLDTCRTLSKPPRLVFSSSLAVFGGTMPTVIADYTLPQPQNSYGTQKFICEQLIADYTRKGYIDGRAARLMTVTVRPGKPNGAASSFFSGIIREPLAGTATTCPVDASVSHPVSSPGNTVHGLITVFEASREAFGGRMALNLPGLNVKVSEMLAALKKVAGPAVHARVTFEKDERIAAIVDNWAQGCTFERAQALGLRADENFEVIIAQYIEDCKTRPGYPAEALNGLK
jgi:nucleoside-diphosphate-sugar epimerase